MKMKTRHLLSLLVLILLLGACATLTPAPTQAPATEVSTAAAPPAREAVTLSYAIWDAEQLPAHEKIIANFEAGHPNIHVEPQVIPWPEYWNKLQTAIAGGQAYDVFWMNGPNFPVYASKGALIDLQPMVDRDSLDLSVYPPSLVELYSYNGHVYGLPKDFDTIALFYNKDMFDAAGVKYPDETWTWDDLKAAAKALTTKDTWGIGVPVDAQCVWFNFVYQNGGKVVAPDGSKVLLDEPAACEAIKFLYSFIEEGLSPDAATMLASDTETQLFPGGKVAMYTCGSWLASYYHEAEPNIDVAPLPKGKQRASIIHGLANVIWSGTKHLDEAWEFLKFLGGPEAARILAETGTVIPAYQGYQETWVNAIPDMNLKVFMDALEYAVPYPSVAQGMEWSDKVNEVLSDAWLGSIPIDEACKLAAEAGNAALQKR